MTDTVDILCVCPSSAARPGLSLAHVNLAQPERVNALPTSSPPFITRSGNKLSFALNLSI